MSCSLTNLVIIASIMKWKQSGNQLSFFYRKNDGVFY